MKVLFKVGLLLVIVGAFLFGVFYVAGGSAQLPSGTEDYSLVEDVYDPVYDSLILEMENRAIQLVIGTTDQIVVKYYVSDKDRIEVDTDDDALHFTNEIDRVFGWFFFGWNQWNVNPEYRKFIVQMPAGWVPDLDLETSNGAISVTTHAVHGFGDVKLRSSNGAISISNVDTVGAVDLYTSNGAIELTNVLLSNTVKLRTSNGGITITNLTATSLDATSSNGRIQLESSAIGNLTKLKTSNGRIIVDQSIVHNLDARTSNGDIDITLTGLETNYHIQMTTSLGKRYLNGLAVDDSSIHPEQSRYVIASTSNGDVRVRFE